MMMNGYNLLKENKNLVNFCYDKNFFTDEEIKKINTIYDNQKHIDGTIGNGRIDHSIRNSKIVKIALNNETKFIYDKLVTFIKHVNNQIWNFNITNIIDLIQIAEYNGDSNTEEQGHYDWHVDIGTDYRSARKISISLQLSDETEYEGGDLELMLGNKIEKMTREKGSIICFPSYIVHRVNKVTKGQRKSLVIWIHGPPFV